MKLNGFESESRDAIVIPTIQYDDGKRFGKDGFI